MEVKLKKDHCLVCQMELVRYQKKFCSGRCQNKYYRPNVRRNLNLKGFNAWLRNKDYFNQNLFSQHEERKEKIYFRNQKGRGK